MAAENVCQLVKTPDGKLIFPDELGAAVISRALLGGAVFHRRLEPEIPQSAQPRSVQIIVGISHSDSDSTGTNYYEAYSPNKHPEPESTLSLLNEISSNPVLSPENTGPRSLTTVRKHGASKADFRDTHSGERHKEPALTVYGRILMELVNCGDELLSDLIPDSGKLKNEKIRQEVVSMSEHQLSKLSGGIKNKELAEEYALVNSLIQALNTLGKSLFSRENVNIPW